MLASLITLLSVPTAQAVPTDADFDLLDNVGYIGGKLANTGPSKFLNNPIPAIWQVLFHGVRH